MWTLISWDRAANQWFHMRGFHDETQATERLQEWIQDSPPHIVVSLSNPTGTVVMAGIGVHSVIGWCGKFRCWCEDLPLDADHTMPERSSNT